MVADVPIGYPSAKASILVTLALPLWHLSTLKCKQQQKNKDKKNKLLVAKHETAKQSSKALSQTTNNNRGQNVNAQQ